MTDRDHAETPWTTLSTTPVYRNRWISVREDLARMPDGRRTIYGVVTCAPAVGVLPFLDDDTVLLIRQWRYVVRRPTWEMPTGGVHRGETLEAAARRELAEETGHRAARLLPLGRFDTSKSVMDETAHLFVARDLAPAPARTRDETEFIRVRAFPFAEALRMVEASEITDAMTVVAVLLAARQRAGA